MLCAFLTAFGGNSSATISGAAPMLGDEVFAYLNEQLDFLCIPDLTIYYIEGTTGWTSPTWNGYPTAAWSSDTKTD